MRKKNFFQHWEGLNPQPLSPNPQSLSPLNMFLAISLCVSVFNALTFESLNLESSYFVCSYIVRIFRSGSYIKASESRSRSQEQKGTSVSCSRVVYICLKGNLVAITVISAIISISTQWTVTAWFYSVLVDCQHHWVTEWLIHWLGRLASYTQQLHSISVNHTPNPTNMGVDHGGDEGGTSPPRIWSGGIVLPDFVMLKNFKHQITCITM